MKMKLIRKKIRAKPESNLSTRSFATELEVRDLDSGGHGISGYAIVFNQPSEDLGFIEYITPNALDKVDLKQLLLLYGHDFNNILARADSGTLTTKVDEKGLFFNAKIPNTTLGTDVYNNIENGNIKGASFRFDVAEDGDEWITDENGQLIHTVTKISNLPEISLTPYPAYSETSVQIERSKENYLSERENKQMPKDVLDNLKNKENTRDAETGTESSPKSLNLSADDIQAVASAVVSLLKTDNTNDASADDKKDPENENGSDASTDIDEDNDIDDNEDDKKRNQNSKKTFVRQRGVKGGVVKVTGSERDKKAQMAIRSFGQYVESHGNVRDNLTTGTEGEVLIPKAVMEAYQQPEDSDKLTSQVRKVAVSEPSGSLPIIKKGTARFTTKAELAANPELTKMEISAVEYKLQTYAGSIPISNEMMSDYPQIGNIVSDYIQTMRALTEQDKIGAILQTAPASVANDADGLKTAVNLGLSNYSKTWVVSESAYNFIDLLKDKQGRYMFNDSLTSPSGKSLCGYGVIVVPDTVLGSAGQAHAFVGDLKAFVLEPYKDEASVKWMDNDIYSQKLAAYIRADFQKADEDAGKFLTLDAAKPTPTPSTTE